MKKITVAGVADMPVVKALFEEYQRWLGVDLCFQGFAQELAELPGRYAAPGGFILLAVDGQSVCGCVAVRPLDNGQAELKRLFVRQQAQGSGVGRMLFDEAMHRTAQLGYEAILLDTLPQMKTAQGMYLKKGFIETLPYTHNPVEGVQYFKYIFVENVGSEAMKR